MYTVYLGKANKITAPTIGLKFISRNWKLFIKLFCELFIRKATDSHHSNEQDTLEEESEEFLKLIILEVMGGMKGQFAEFSLGLQPCTEIYR